MAEFTLTQDHIALMGKFHIRWEDFAYDGAPAVDIKRPFGNSDVIEDVVEILLGLRDTSTWEEREKALEKAVTYDREGSIKSVVLPDARVLTRSEMETLYRQMDTALQVVLCTQSFAAGTYRQEHQYDAISWKLVS